jgi:hypothetical protein
MPSTTEINLEEIYAFTLDLAKEAGQMILEGSNKRTTSSTTATGDSVESKKNRVDRTCAFSLSTRVLKKGEMRVGSWRGRGNRATTEALRRVYSHQIFSHAFPRRP